MFWKKKPKSPEAKPAPLPAKGTVPARGTEAAAATSSSHNPPGSPHAADKPSTHEAEQPSVASSSLELSSPHQYFEKAHSALSEGTVIQGSLSFDRAVRIDGSMSGKVFSSDALLLGQSSKVKADIDVRALVVEGSLSGSVRARERIVLLASAHVTADISAPSVVIEQGARFEGKCSMLSESQASERDGSGFQTQVIVQDDEEEVVAADPVTLAAEKEKEENKQREGSASLH